MASQLPELHQLICEHLRCANLPEDLLGSVERSLEKANGKKLSSRLAKHFHACKCVRPAGDLVDSKAAKVEGSNICREPREQSTPKSFGSSGWILAGLGVFLLSMIFAPCVTYSEWYIDELFAAVRNADARGETPLAELLQHDFWGNSLASGWTHKSYRPLVVLSYVGQYWMNNWDFRPQSLRTFNVALHSANTVLLLILMRRLNMSRRFAFLAAGCFAVHPVHAENAIYLVGRADSMATCCWLLAFLVWLPGRSRSFGLAWFLRTCLVTLLALVGGFCKETGFCVLLQLAAVELLGKSPGRSLPLMVLFGIVFAGRSWITQGTSAGFSFVDTPVQYRNDPWLRLATYLYFHAKYAQLMVWPWTLSWDYSYDALPDLSSTWQDVRVLAILMSYLGICALASWAFSQRNRPALIGLCNIIIPFVPASNLFFLVGVTVGERLLYPCNVGAALVLAAFGTRSDASQKKSAPGRCSMFFRLAPLAAGILVMFTWLGAVRTYQWSARDLLFGTDAESYPQSTKNRHQFGSLWNKGVQEMLKFKSVATTFYTVFDHLPANCSID